MKKPIRIYTQNESWKLGSYRRQTQTSYLYHPDMDLNDFIGWNEEQLREDLQRQHAEDYTGRDDDMIDSLDSYAEENRGEHAAYAMSITQDAYDSDDWGYREPQGAEYYDMTLMGYAWNITEQKRHKTKHPVQKEAEDILRHNHYITNNLY